jgi:uncharacterized protein (DUF697 family)
MPYESIERAQAPTNAIIDIANPTLRTLYRLEDRNRIAREFISNYANKHAKMDIAVGVVGLFPFLSIPALGAAIAAQSPLIYQPLARDLANVYMAEPGELEKAKHSIVHQVSLQTGVLDVAANFGTDFMLQIAGELITEMGLGVGLSAIPILGGVVGAGLDYIIATQMTWRVGSMVSIYFQNGGEWVDNQKHTFELAKELTGSMSVGIRDLLTGNVKNHTPRADLNDIRENIPVIRENLLKNLRGLANMLREVASDEKVREILRSRGIPIDLINEVLEHLA